MSRTETDVLNLLRNALGGRYAVRRELGRGGMATVYLADDLRHGRRVALKVLHQEMSGGLGAERFLREIQIAAQLNHPHILPLLDSGKADEFLYFVAPYVEGETLREYLNRVGQLSLDEALRITAEVAGGLAYAHSRGLVHRDVKPENILLSSGHAVLADFGIARAIDEAGDDRLTRSGFAAGTAAYMSPEQWAGSTQIDGRSDLYSLACVLYEMLIGEPPFTGSSTQVLMARHTQAPVPSLRLVRPNVPDALETAVARALAKVPGDRFGSEPEFAAALHEADALGTPGGTGPRATPAIGPPPRGLSTLLSRKRFVAAALALAVLSAVVLGVLFAPDWMRRFAPAPLGAQQSRLIVLPFADIGGDGDTYFADGITEEITSSLAAVGSLGVIARTSAQQYRSTSKTAQEIGQELSVDYLIEGSVRRQRYEGGVDTLRVTARLIRTDDGSNVWGDSWNVEASGIFQVQAEIAERVADAMDIVLAGDERVRLTAQKTDDLQAYDEYLRGNDRMIQSWAQQDVEAAIRHYEAAIERDPDFAAAYARLGRANAWMHQLRYDLSEDRLVASKRAADRALALDPDLADAHIALGYYYYWGRDNYERAVEAFEVAEQLAPSGLAPIVAIANVRRRQGRFDDAIANYRKAAELDPRSYTSSFNLGETLLFTRQYAAAREPLARATELNPEFLEGWIQRARLEINESGNVEAAREFLRAAHERIPATAWRGVLLDFARMLDPNAADLLDRLRPGAYGLDSASYHMTKAGLLLQTGNSAASRAQCDSALVWLEQMREERPDQAWIHGLIAHAYAGVGRADDAVRSATRAMQLLPVSEDALDGPEWVINMAQVQMRVGRMNEAIRHLRYALSIPSWISVNSIRVDPLWQPIEDAPAFRTLANAGAGARSSPAAASSTADSSPVRILPVSNATH